MQPEDTLCPLMTLSGKNGKCRKHCQWYNDSGDSNEGCVVRLLPEIASSLKSIVAKSLENEGN